MRFRIIILAWVILGLLCWWHSRQPRPASVPVQASVQAASAPQPVASVPEEWPAVVPAVAPVAVAESRSGLILAKLPAWDDDDRPDLREQRIEELAALLEGTNALGLIQNVPANLMGYVFAVPSVREKLLADPQGALDWMSQHTNVQGQLQTFLHDWGQADKEEMQEMISALPAGAWKEQVTAAAANEALTTDPAAAVALAMQMEAAPQQNPSLNMAMTEWAKQDPYTAAQLANQAGDSALREQLFKDVTAGLASSNPQQAAELAAQFITDGNTLNEAVGDISWAWALQDSATASAWVTQLPDGDGQQAALKNLMSVWGNHDANAATTWVESLPEGPLQTQAAADLLPVVSRPE